jgi:signal transduction histidine kinase
MEIFMLYWEHLQELVKKRTIELEKKTKELEKANLKLQELDRLKSMFIASMSHELRTPLNSIIGFTGIILQGMSGEINEIQRKQLTLSKNSANHLLNLINDVIDISKIETDNVELYIQEFDLTRLVHEIKDSFAVAVDKKGLEFSLETPPILLIESDERRTKQVLVNFISNGLKFTDRGKIEIKIVKKDETVEIAVKDTGIGIRKEDMDKLFKAFSQIYTPGRVKEGTGLGLYLSKRIAYLLGGDIKTESEFGKGSAFTLTLPVKR